MNMAEIEKIHKGLLLCALALTSIAVVPKFADDSFNVPKMLILVALTSSILGLMLRHQELLGIRSHNRLLIVLGTFLGFQLLVMVVSGPGILQQFYGTGGRNTGWLTYFSASLLLLSAMKTKVDSFRTLFFRTSWIVGGLSVLYGLLQSIGKDPIDWVNPYSPVVGFLGNPNFQASFVGIIATIAVAALLSSGVPVWKRAVLFAFILIALYEIKKTSSEQGFMVFLVGGGIVGYLFLRAHVRKGLILTYLFMFFGGALTSVFGLLNKGPLAGLLHKDSVIYRGDYWRAGIKMTLDHPFFGVGLDSYGDWYRRARTVEATLRRGPDVVSSAAHNVLLDLSAGGGIPLLVLYLTIMGFVVSAAICILKRSKSFDPYFAAILGAWLAYHVQSLISINQIGLLIWGWVLSGLIIGYEFYGREQDSVVEKSASKSPKVKVKFSSSGSYLIIVLGMTIGFAIAAPPFISTVKYRLAVESSNGVALQKVVTSVPIDTTALVQSSILFEKNKYNQQALELIMKANQVSPNSFEAWRVLSLLSLATPDQVAEAKAQMKRLDPHNPDLK